MPWISDLGKWGGGKVLSLQLEGVITEQECLISSPSPPHPAPHITALSNGVALHSGPKLLVLSGQLRETQS